MSRVISISKSSSYDRRRELSAEADRRRETVIKSVLRDGFTFDWPAMLRAIGEASDPVDALARVIDDELRCEDFRDTLGALMVNGKCIAIYIQRRHELDAGIKAPVIPVPMEFRETTPQLFTPTGAVEYWEKILKLSSEDIAALLASGDNPFRSISLETATGKIRRKLLEKIASLHRDVVGEGLALEEFKKQAREILPGFSESELETEFRTTQTDVYGKSRHELALSRANAFPFMQFIALLDSRTTWNICRPMGTAVNGKGYIAATEDVIWFTWRPPNHYNCRTDLSPISYLEAQRMKILAKDGRTKIAIVGSNPNRPFGPPPKFAKGPDGAIKLVQPAPGFGL